MFGLSLGLLEYYHALLATLAVLVVLLVLEQLTGRAGAILRRASGRAAPNARIDGWWREAAPHLRAPSC